MSTAAIVGGSLAGAGASLFGANKQANAAQSAAQLSYQSQEDALAFQKNQFNTEQQNAAPWLSAGSSAINQLNGMLQPGGSLTQGYGQNFTAPTAAEAAATPGYQFTLGQGLQALDRGAAAKGNLLTGGTMKAEQQYGQGLASTTYQQTYNNALQNYMTNYNQWSQQQSRTYNQLAGVSGAGQTTAGQLAASGQQAANNISNIYQTGAQQQNNALQNAAAATASGYVGAANSLGGLGQYALLQNILGNSNGSGMPAFGNFSPTQISAAFGGPSYAAPIATPATDLLPEG